MDYNLYYNPNIPVVSVRFQDQALDEWQERGKDVHSVITDPSFVNPEHYDFRLLTNYPAFDLGFQPIDMSKVGPRTTSESREEK